jgi:hypothetical protein
MKQFVLTCFISVFMAGGAAAQTAPAKALSPFEQKLIAAEKSFIAAAKKGDAEYFKRTFTDDYSQVGSDGQLHTREEILGEFGSGGVELLPYDIKVLELGENEGIVTYDVVLQIPPVEDQGAPPRYQHWSSVWTKQGDNWKLKFQQTTPTHWGDW